MTMRSLGVVMVVLLLLTAGGAGAVVRDNVKLTIVAAPHGKEEKGGKSIRAEALVDRINTSEQLKPIALELLEHLKSTCPNCQSITLVLSNDARMMKIGNYLAVATVKDGKTTVTGGIPTNMDIRVMKASRVEVRKPDPLGMQVAYDVALLKKEAVKKGQPLTDDKAYALVAKKQKLNVAQVKQVDRGITQYYKAFAGKEF
jgi:hypothetical protein